MNLALAHTRPAGSVPLGLLIAICSFGQAVPPQTAPVRSNPSAAPSAVSAPNAKPALPPGGLETPWDVRKFLTDLDASNAQLKTLLAEINPQTWYEEKGAPSTYTLQLQTAQRQVNEVLTVTHRLATRTEDLPLAMDAYFRLESLEVA